MVEETSNDVPLHPLVIMSKSVDIAHLGIGLNLVKGRGVRSNRLIKKSSLSTLNYSTTIGALEGALNIGELRSDLYMIGAKQVINKVLVIIICLFSHCGKGAGGNTRSVKSRTGIIM